MSGPLSAVAFLARSEHRVAILRALATDSRDRRELEAATGASRSTLSRALADLEDRGWIDHESGTYRITTAGSLLVERFVPLLETVEAVETLGDGLALLPVEEMDLDVRHFHDATVHTPTEWDPTAAFEYGVEKMRDSDSLRSVGRTVPPPYVRALRAEVAAGDLAVEVVLDGDYLDAMAGSELAGQWADIAAREDVLRADRYVPYRLLVLDDVVHMWLCSDEGDQVGLLESESPTVREWAETTVDAFVAAATPLEPDLLA